MPNWEAAEAPVVQNFGTRKGQEEFWVVLVYDNDRFCDFVCLGMPGEILKLWEGEEGIFQKSYPLISFVEFL